ncbi:hypothetical protein BOTBODRAFT_72896, partial [Botryobasidium botryosum FD-172 SS1]
KYLLSYSDWELLEQVAEVLKIPHQVQQVMSSKTTPSLSMAVPAMEAMVQGWDILEAKMPHLSVMISAGRLKIQQYLSVMRNQKAYVIAMVLNPSCKLHWIDTHW